MTVVMEQMMKRKRRQVIYLQVLRKQGLHCSGVGTCLCVGSSANPRGFLKGFRALCMKRARTCETALLRVDNTAQKVAVYK